MARRKTQEEFLAEMKTISKTFKSYGDAVLFHKEQTDIRINKMNEYHTDFITNIDNDIV